VLAYQCVQLIRSQLNAKGIDQSWASLRETLSVQRRVTARFTQREGRTHALTHNSFSMNRSHMLDPFDKIPDALEAQP
jgi:hypothetical protein